MLIQQQQPPPNVCAGIKRRKACNKEPGCKFSKEKCVPDPNKPKAVVKVGEAAALMQPQSGGNLSKQASMLASVVSMLMMWYQWE